MGEPPSRKPRPSLPSLSTARHTGLSRRRDASSGPGWYRSRCQNSGLIHQGGRSMVEHRLATKLDRILQGQVPLLRFFSESPWSTRDPADPDNADFVAGNPQEMVMPEFVRSEERRVGKEVCIGVAGVELYSR